MDKARQNMLRVISQILNWCLHQPTEKPTPPAEGPKRVQGKGTVFFIKKDPDHDR